MAALKVRNLWTAFITAFFALLASVGLTTATRRPAVRTPEVPVVPVVPKQHRRQAVRPTVPSPSTPWSRAARDRSLPPTIKQRIRAEAHGSSPATRHLPAADADSADLADIAPGPAADRVTDTASASA
ncbi:hypothetical protein FBY35_3531 [Streptomyces sp. SLBN-118]|uniref:DUF6344 domain-containing protein n=1 Tax=Streptomyces sp. SLBN-118 TaxID=2768454 RepID=UPI001167F216|nr:DUF6344 domain-containing protein [Streptomyces sp. SLBN-118]TQK53061.1 hypothetical protein FBY35_3531 [Streptomyces sp. SLBN-118]